MAVGVEKSNLLSTLTGVRIMGVKMEGLCPGTKKAVL